MARATQLRAAPQSGTELGGAWEGEGHIQVGFGCALAVVFFCMSQTNLVMSRVSSFSSWLGVGVRVRVRVRVMGTGRGAGKVAGRAPGPAAPRPARQ